MVTPDGGENTCGSGGSREIKGGAREEGRGDGGEQEGQVTRSLTQGPLY